MVDRGAAAVAVGAGRDWGGISAVAGGMPIPEALAESMAILDMIALWVGGGGGGGGGDVAEPPRAGIVIYVAIERLARHRFFWRGLDDRKRKAFLFRKRRGKEERVSKRERKERKCCCERLNELAPPSLLADEEEDGS